MGACDSVWKRVNPNISWLALAHSCNSFVSKALAAISITAIVIGNSGDILDFLGVSGFYIKTTFIGAGVFLVGYIGRGIFSPSEFRSGGEINEIVGRMTMLADWNFFSSRRDLASALLESTKKRKNLKSPDGDIYFLQDRLKGVSEISDKGNWKELAPGLYHADLNLRQTVFPLKRIGIAILLTIGIFLLSLSTIRNVFVAIFNF